MLPDTFKGNREFLEIFRDFTVWYLNPDFSDIFIYKRSETKDCLIEISPLTMVRLLEVDCNDYSKEPIFNFSTLIGAEFGNNRVKVLDSLPMGWFNVRILNS